MRLLFCSLTVLVFTLTACATATKNEQMRSLWEKYNAHCTSHAIASTTTGSPDEETLYRDCMNYFIKEDVKCSYCVVKSQ
jgi:hypothetical protein